MKLEKSQILFSPQDEDLRQYYLYFDILRPNQKNKYIMCEYPSKMKLKRRYLHRIVAKRMGLFKSNPRSRKCVYYANGNVLDNRRENIKLSLDPASLDFFSKIIVSPEDEDLLQWIGNLDRGYVRCSFTLKDKRYSKTLHQVIADRMGLKSDRYNHIDHINRNKLDNRRENLRLVPRLANLNNSDQKLKGKGYREQDGKFVVFFNRKYVGYFDTEKEARQAYVEVKNKRLTELGLTDLLLKE